MRESKTIELEGRGNVTVSELTIGEIDSIIGMLDIPDIAEKTLINLVSRNGTDLLFQLCDCEGSCISLPEGLTSTELTFSEALEIGRVFREVNAPFFDTFGQLFGLASMMAAMAAMRPDEPALESTGGRFDGLSGE